LRIRNDLQKASYFRFSNELSDSKLLLGKYERDTNDFDKLNDLMNADARYENCDLIHDPVVQYQTMLDTLK